MGKNLSLPKMSSDANGFENQRQFKKTILAPQRVCEKLWTPPENGGLS
jgi:hypothetical protein